MKAAVVKQPLMPYVESSSSQKFEAFIALSLLLEAPHWRWSDDGQIDGVDAENAQRARLAWRALMPLVIQDAEALIK